MLTGKHVVKDIQALVESLSIEQLGVLQRIMEASETMNGRDRNGFCNIETARSFIRSTLYEASRLWICANLNSSSTKK